MTHHWTRQRTRIGLSITAALALGALAVPLAFAAGPSHQSPNTGCGAALLADATNTACGDTHFDSATGTWAFSTAYSPNFSDTNALTGTANGQGAGVLGRGILTNSAGIDGYAPYLGGYAQADNALGNGQGFYGFADNDYGYGLIGDANSGANGGVGVWGLSYKNEGVMGTTSGGTTSGQWTAGVMGWNYHVTGGDSASNAGVYGYCQDCNGVVGESANYVGVRGNANGGTTSFGGVFSNTHGTGVMAQSYDFLGVWGYSYLQAGVQGVSTRSIGVYGYSEREIGVYAESESYVGMFARLKNKTIPNAWAGIFDGNVGITGQLIITTPPESRVSTTQGDRLLYSGQSTKNLYSDQGTAQLVNGVAVVHIDSLYAQTVNLGVGYQVFLTPRSFTSKGLAVGNITASSFEVRELNAGTGSYSFDWRIDGAPRGLEAVRMASAPTVPQAPVDSPVLIPVVPAKAPLILGPRVTPPVAAPVRPVAGHPVR